MIKKTDNGNEDFNWGNISARKFVKNVSFIVGALFIISVILIVLFPDPFINTILKKQIAKSFEQSYPEYSIQLGEMRYSVWNNFLECDSIKLQTKDSSFTCSLDSFSIGGISWMKILTQSDFNPDAFSSSIINAEKIIMSFHESMQELSIKKFHISLPDSELTTSSIKYHHLIEDEQFFAKSKFRQTRLRLDISQINIIGLDFMSFLRGNTYSARKINLQDVFADILLNKDKPGEENLSAPQMPNELLSSIKEIIKVDSLEISNGNLKYSERFAVKSVPGIITFNKFNIYVSGIANHIVQPETTIIRGDGLFMNSASMKIFMALPLASKEFSLRYSGSVSRMDLAKLNIFLEPVENRRIKSGVIQSATYNINVNSGQASGNLRVAYNDLAIAVSNKNTIVDKVLLNRISNYVANMFIIRTINLPDEKGSMKIGEINYLRNPRDHFFQFLWFSLRSGIGDVVGF
jgi:hypothetical protein